MSQSRTSIAPTPWLDFWVVLGLCWGLWTVQSILSAAGLPTPVRMSWPQFVLYELLAGTAAIVYLVSRGWQLGDFPITINWRTTAAGLLLLFVDASLHKIAYGMGKALGGSTAVLDQLKGELSAPMALLVSAVNGPFEELLLLSFVFKALERQPLSVIIGASVLIRMLAHIYQGPVGVLSIFLMGVLFALLYARFRQVWPLIVCHIAEDFFALVK